MTLTQFIDDDEIKKAIDEKFPKPNKKIDKDIICNPQSKNYALVGQSFDYIARFWIERQSDSVQKEDWNASHGLNIVRQQLPSYKENCEKLYNNAEYQYNEYLKTGNFNKKTVQSAIDLSRLTTVYRSGYTGVLDNMGTYDEGDIEDCLNLYNSLDNSNALSCTNSILNPSFGDISRLVGNADADIIIDNKLIDIKTTKNAYFKKKDWRQIVGYAILVDLYNELCLSGNSKINIDELGIYFSRHSVLKVVDSDYLYENNNYKEFRAWFVDKALNKYNMLEKPQKDYQREIFCEPYDYSNQGPTTLNDF